MSKGQLVIKSLSWHTHTHKDRSTWATNKNKWLGNFEKILHHMGGGIFHRGKM